MAAGVLLDTSFLITLASHTRPHHETARRHWRRFLESRIPIRALCDANGPRDFGDEFRGEDAPTS